MYNNFYSLMDYCQEHKEEFIKVKVRYMEELVKTHKDLRIWKSAINMVEEVYKLTDQIPKHKMYG